MPNSEDEMLATLPQVHPILDQIANKWTVLVLTFICEKPQRFNTIRRRLDGLSQKVLTETLRRLERNGLVVRRVIPVSPVAVEYSITPLGRTLQAPFSALYEWLVQHQPDIANAQTIFDEAKAQHKTLA
jgi:DNA-binding HxlR family transcriptional regulator